MRKMIDTDERRDDRVALPKDDAQRGPLPNRKMRRKIAKDLHVFKRPGAWRYVNEGRRVNQPLRGDQNNEKSEA